ncbi:MAG TPA: hypothetical protein VGQ24_05005 [Gemmatimonadales bacterium]|nr:hypothetical protein [Gemmatimonadales bacterium]
MLHEVHRPHATFAEQLEDLIGADALVDPGLRLRDCRLGARAILIVQPKRR